MSSPLLVAVIGPTASGKTALALHLAEQLKGEIVNCDSVAVYREFEIGTAKPSRPEREGVPHHMIDIARPTEAVTAGDYARLARAAIHDISARDLIPIVAGGTGLYLRALLEGLFPGPARSEELRSRLRERASKRGAHYLHRMLRRLDPSAALSIHENDLPKVIRALEVSISARAPMTGLWQQGRDPLRGFHIVRIGLNPDREALYARINTRVREMFAAGLVAETRALSERYGDAVWPLRSLGYKQALQHLRGQHTLEEAITEAAQGHRNYAKRQMTWFRRELEVQWFAGFGSDPNIQKAVTDLVATGVAPTGRPREGG